MDIDDRVEAQREKIPVLLGRNNKLGDVIRWKSQRVKVERGNLKLLYFAPHPTPTPPRVYYASTAVHRTRD